jgi:glyoxylase-like metal-dependent hydrolase (beta-lactamase superfamily II)
MRSPACLPVVVAATLCAGMSARAQVRAEYGAVAESFATVKLADGIMAFIAPDSKTPFVSGNSLAIVGETGVLVVDTGHVPKVTRRMIEEIRKATEMPVRYVVNTHWHFDHLMGNAEYTSAFPGAIVVSTEAAAAQMRVQVPPYAAMLTKQIGPALETIRDTLRTGTKRDGSPMSADDRAFFEAEVHDFEAARPSLADMRYVPPSLTFDRELHIDLGGREVRIMFLGRGNTAGDAVVYVPDARVVATGDLVVAPVPYATASFMFDWVETMKKLTSLDAAAIVPGHGPLMHDWSYANRVSEMLAAITKQAADAVSAGLSIEEARKKIDLSSFRAAFAGSDPFQMRIFDAYFRPGAVDRAYREAAFLAEK